MKLLEWTARYRANLVATLKKQKDDCVVQISPENLFAITPIPSDGPRGTNATWLVHQIFDELVAKVSVPGIKIF